MNIYIVKYSPPFSHTFAGLAQISIVLNLEFFSKFRREKKFTFFFSNVLKF